MSGDDFFRLLYLRQALIHNSYVFQKYILVSVYSSFLNCNFITYRVFQAVWPQIMFLFKYGIHCRQILQYSQWLYIWLYICLSSWFNYNLMMAGPFNVYKDYAFYPGKASFLSSFHVFLICSHCYLSKYQNSTQEFFLISFRLSWVLLVLVRSQQQSLVPLFR